MSGLCGAVLNIFPIYFLPWGGLGNGSLGFVFLRSYCSAIAERPSRNFWTTVAQKWPEHCLFR